MLLRSSLLLLVLLPSLVFAGALRVVDDAVLVFSAEDFPDAVGKNIQRLSVVRWQDDDFVPVPFQIDEMDRVSLVWFEQSGFERLGSSGLFDQADQLLLMARDAGLAAPDTARLSEGELLSRIRITPPGEDARYFYLAKDNSQRNLDHYVSHDPLTGVTSTAHYVLTTDPSNELNWQYLGYSGYRGRADASLIDTLKMRMSGGVLLRFPRVTLDNNNLKPTLIGFRIGQIRSVMHLETRVVFAGLPMMTLHVQAHRYANHYEAHTYARIPGLYRSTLRNPQVSVSIDGNNLTGATVRTARGDGLIGHVDGRMDEDERKLVKRGLSSDESWILFDSHKGFALLTELDVPIELHGIPLELVYQDDKNLNVKPEQYPGQLPNLGYALNGWPEQDEMRFSVRMFFDRAFGSLPPEEYVSLRTGRALAVQIESMLVADGL
ncbi:MAG: hypothetical protein CVV10_06215 [Gammaproteobacteria bacterium HGW-Gammaproteobacteria-14]|nr:MAG: hypothetical protein CVV10_06215 [Gammaproteobacteria bacterium HGW-Gammaproteobacteria-14]